MEPTPSTSFPGSWSLSLGMANRRVPIDSSWWLLVVYDEFMVVYWSSLMTWPSSSTPSFHTSKPRSYRIQFHLVIPFHRNHRNPIKRKELEIQTTHGTHGFSYWKIILKSIVFHSCPLFLIADFADLKSQRLSPTFGTPGDHFKASSPENNSSGVPGNTSRADHTSERTIMTTGGFIDRTTTSIGIAPKKYQMEKKHTPLSTFYRRYEFRGIWVKYCKIMTFGSIYMEEHVEDPNLGGGPIFNRTVFCRAQVRCSSCILRVYVSWGMVIARSDWSSTAIWYIKHMSLMSDRNGVTIHWTGL